MTPRDDWTTGPAKWAAALVLGAASIAGLTWSALARRSPAQWSIASAPARPAPAQPEERPEQAGPVTPAPPAATAAGRLININSASASELELLPGVGPAMAGRIIEYRRQNGRFRSVDSLDEVKGIGPRTLEKLRPLIRVD
jgi:competence protein ComEA